LSNRKIITITVIILLLDLLFSILAFHNKQYIFGTLDIVCFIAILISSIYTLKRHS